MRWLALLGVSALLLAACGDDDNGSASTPESVIGTWRAISYNNGAEAVVSVINGSEITAEFGAGGTLSGLAGCNNYSGEFETDGSSISIGPLTRTEIACLEPEGVMEQENEYLTALETASTWTIEGAGLELRTDDGALVAQYSLLG